MGLPRLLALAIITLGIAFALPASALAASGSLTDCDPNAPHPNTNCTMSYSGDVSGNNAVVTLVNGDYELHDPGAQGLTAQSPCFTTDSQTMACPAQNVSGDVQVARLSIGLGGGDDSVSVQADLPAELRGGDGNDSMTGGPQGDTIYGDNPDGTGAGNDTIEGGNGNDNLFGGDGNDTFPAEATSDGADDLHGGAGTDTASFALRTQPLQLSIDGVANDGLQGNAADNIETDVENVVGGSAGDIITGSDAANALDGGGGNDAIQGGAGSDTLSGGDGQDSLSGGGDSDALDGGAGADAESGGDGNDSLGGGSGDDTLDGGQGADTLAGGDGTDLGDYASRAAGVTVTLDGQPGDGEPGENDNVEPDVENLRGGSGADTFIGSAAANNLDGGGGENYEDGGAGADTLTGGASGDVFRTRGSSEGDTVSCGPGPDFVVAKPADHVTGDCDRVDRGVNQRPRAHDSAVVTPAGGALQMSPTGIVRRVPLLDKVVLPLRSVVDTTLGIVRVAAALGRKVQTVALYAGAFDISQAKGASPTTSFALQGGDFGACPAGARAAGPATIAAATGGGKVVRRLWASGKGKFRTRGRYAAAAVRGTKWLTEDRCDGTRIRVVRGAVAVTDLVKHTTIVVKAGKSYFARARR